MKGTAHYLERIFTATPHPQLKTSPKREMERIEMVSEHASQGKGKIG